MDLQTQYVNSELSLVSLFASGIYTKLPITQAQAHYGYPWIKGRERMSAYEKHITRMH